MTETERSYHSNGSLAAEVTLVDGRPHGMTRHWHPNGVLAMEIPLDHGIIDGIVKQWDEAGKLLGTSELVKGTGVHRLWYPTGKLQGEISYVDGKMTGRARAYFEDGELAGEMYWLENKKVAKRRYQEASRLNPDFPKYEDEPRPVHQQRRKTARQGVQAGRHHKVTAAEIDGLTSQLLNGSRVREALAWLTERRQPSRSLGESTDQEESVKLVKSLYELDAVSVHVVDISGEVHEDQNSGRVVVELPQGEDQRKRLLRFCGRLAKQAGFDPDPDVGQRYALLLLD